MSLMAIAKSWFAVLNDKDIVEEVLQMPSSVSGSEFIVIPAEDQGLVWKVLRYHAGWGCQVICVNKITRGYRIF